jgi:hypothetical protein
LAAELESPNFATKLNFVAHMTDYEYILEQCRQFNEIFVDEECPNELFMSVNSIASIKDLAPKSKKMDAFIDLINNLVAPPWKEPF